MLKYVEMCCWCFGERGTVYMLSNRRLVLCLFVGWLVDLVANFVECFPCRYNGGKVQKYFSVDAWAWEGPLL